jgi:hypothetical protein
LPEGSEEEEETAGSGRGGLFLRIGLVIGLIGVLGFWAYYFLGDYILERIGRRDLSSVQNPDPSANIDSSLPSSSPASDPQVPPVTSGDRNLSGSDPGSIEPASPPNTRSSGDQEDPVDKLFQAPPPQQNPGAKEKQLSVQPPPLPKADAIPRNPRPSNPARESSSLGAGGSRKSRLTIQVGSFKDQGEAEAKASGLNAATDGEFHVVQAAIPGRGVWYRVQQVRGFASREAALNYGNQLRGRNLISDFIVTVR